MPTRKPRRSRRAAPRREGRRVSPRVLSVREDHKRLLDEFEKLRVEFETLQKAVAVQAHELHLQFVRIAQLQAVLDEERRDDAVKSALGRAKPASRQ